jgi:hypothetical protein
MAAVQPEPWLRALIAKINNTVIAKYAFFHFSVLITLFCQEEKEIYEIKCLSSYF